MFPTPWEHGKFGNIFVVNYTSLMIREKKRLHANLCLWSASEVPDVFGVAGQVSITAGCMPQLTSASMDASYWKLATTTNSTTINSSVHIFFYIFQRHCSLLPQVALFKQKCHFQKLCNFCHRLVKLNAWVAYKGLKVWCSRDLQSLLLSAFKNAVYIGITSNKTEQVVYNKLVGAVKSLLTLKHFTRMSH